MTLAPGDLVHWQRVIQRGKKETTQEGHGLVCELGRGYVSIWPLTGDVTRRLQVDITSGQVLLAASDLIGELDSRWAESNP